MQAEGVAIIDIAEGSDHKSGVEIPAAVGGARVVEGGHGGRIMDDTGQPSLLAINIRCHHWSGGRNIGLCAKGARFDSTALFVILFCIESWSIHESMNFMETYFFM
jgi:hypothetical protein